MNRRDFIKLAGLSGLAFLIPYIEIEEEMELGDIWLKVARNQNLTPQEEEFLRIEGKNTQMRNSFIAGNTSAENKLIVPSPITVLFSETLSKDTASINLEVSRDYKNLLFLGSGRTDYVGSGTTIRMQYNYDTGNNYDYTGSGVSDDVATKAQDFSDDSVIIGNFPGTTATTDASGFIFAVLPHLSSGFWKSAMSVRGEYIDSTLGMISYTSYGTWENTSPITSIKIYSSQSANLLAGSSISVYGLL